MASSEPKGTVDRRPIWVGTSFYGFKLGCNAVKVPRNIYSRLLRKI